MTKKEIKNYIETRIKTIESDEKDVKDYGGMTWKTKDVIQELKWVLEKSE